MNSSVITWMSPPVMENSVFMNECDNLMMDTTFDEEFGAIFGAQDVENNSSTCSNSEALINSSSFYNTTTSQILQQPPDSDINYSQFPNMMQSFMINPDDQDSSAPTLNIGNNNPSQNIHHLVNPQESVVGHEMFMSQCSYNVNAEETTTINKVQPTKKKARIRPPSQTYDHIIAERRRREQLSQLFVALSALVPGLKKMDKGSVLEDAIKYLKQLQERVKSLEVKAEKQGVESVILVKKSVIIVEDGQSLEEEALPLPEIEARACENHILVRVHCEKQKGVLVNLLTKIESLNMIIVNTNATSFGNVALDITIIAEMEKEFNVTVKEVVTALREAIQPGA